MKVVCKKSVEKQGVTKFQEGKSYILNITPYGLETFNEGGSLHFLFDIAHLEGWAWFEEHFE